MGYSKVDKKIKKVRLHYLRFDNDYKDWNVWVWQNYYEHILSNKFEFQDDLYGEVTEITVADSHSQDIIGFVIRRSNEKEEWVEKEMNLDRFIYLGEADENGVVEAYIVQNDPMVVIGRDNGDKFFDRSMRDRLREIETQKEICLRINYRRYNDDYVDSNGRDWDIWTWQNTVKTVNKGMAAVTMDEETSYGRCGYVVLKEIEELRKLGFIVRKVDVFGNWIDRDCDMDRFVFISKLKQQRDEKINDIKEKIRRREPVNLSEAEIQDIFLIQGDMKIAYSKEEADVKPKIVKATIDDPGDSDQYNTISIELNIPFKNIPKVDRFKLNSLSEDLEIKEIIPMGDSSKELKIILHESLKPFEQKYFIRLNGYKDAMISCINLYDKKEFEEKLTYDGDDLGATYKKEVTSFRLWAPTARKVELLLYKSGSEEEEPEVIKMSEDVKGTWITGVYRNLDGVFYTYRVNVDGRVNEAVDPYAKALGVNGNRGAIIDLEKTNPEGWYEHDIPVLERYTDAIIEELHVRDYTVDSQSGVKNKGKYLGLVESGTKNMLQESTVFDHLKELGVSHVQIMPTFDFASVDEEKSDTNEYNWGYDPKNFFAPEGSYSTNAFSPYTRIYEFKTMCKNFHEAKMCVNMDMVFNHTFKGEGYCGNLIVPMYYHRTKNGEFTNSLSCGNEVNTERKMVRKMIKDCLKYWVGEYGVDGFRLDVMTAIDQDTIKEIRQELPARIMLYGEGYEESKSLLPDYKKSDLLNAKYLYTFDGNEYRHIGLIDRDFAYAIKGEFNTEKNNGFVTSGTREEYMKHAIVGSIEHDQVETKDDMIILRSPDQAINFVDDHDNLTLKDKLKKVFKTANESFYIRTMKLFYSIMMTSQGIPFLFEGSDFGREKGDIQNTYGLGDEVNKVNWGKLRDEGKNLFRYIANFIKLRQKHPALKLATAQGVQCHVKFLNKLPEGVIGYKISHQHMGGSGSDCEACGERWKEPYENIAVFHNAEAKDFEVDIDILSGESKWDILADGEEVSSSKLREIDKYKNEKIHIPSQSTIVLGDKIVGDKDKQIASLREKMHRRKEILNAQLPLLN